MFFKANLGLDGVVVIDDQVLHVPEAELAEYFVLVFDCELVSLMRRLDVVALGYSHHRQDLRLNKPRTGSNCVRRASSTLRA